MFSYGTDNIVNLDQYEKNQIISIVAPNHHGKSAILDIILYCLFQKCTRGVARDIMNKNERTMSCSLLFSIGEIKYLIVRTAIRGKNDKRMDLTVDFIQIKKNGKQKNLNCINKTKTNSSIVKLIGTIDDYLTSYICTQDQENHGNFMKKTDTGKKEYLYQTLKLNIFDDCYKHASDKTKIIESKIKLLTTEVNRIPIKNTKQQINELQNVLITLSNEKFHLSDMLSLINKNKGFIKKTMPELIKYHELSIYKLDSIDDINDTIRELHTKIKNMDTETITDQISVYQNSISNLKKEKSFDAQISKYNEDIQNLYDKIINIPINKKDEDFDTLSQNKIDIKSKISSVDKILSKLNSKLESISSTTNKKISQKESDILTEQLKMNNNFAKHVSSTIKCIEKCNDPNINTVLKLQNQWLDKYNEWIIETTSLLENETYDPVEIKNQIKLLTNQKETLIDKLAVVRDKIDNLEYYQKQNTINKKIKTKIKHIKNEIKNIELIKSNNKTKIKKLKESIDECNNLLIDSKNYKSHISLLGKFEINFRDYCGKRDEYYSYVTMMENVNNLTTKLNNINYQINNTNIKLEQQMGILEEYKRLNTDIETITNKGKTYKSYCQIMNSNGIPY
jgi:DNA repair exonuclease SbcCD ATPase subunit